MFAVGRGFGPGVGCIGRPAQPVRALAFAPPGGIVEHPDRALLCIECQARDDAHPGGDTFQIIGQFRDVVEQPALPS